MRKIVVFNKMNEALNYELEVFSRFSDVELVKSPAVTEEELIRDAKDAEVILFTAAKLTRKVLTSLERCKLIVRYGIGYDTVDTEAARECGIMVCNSPNYGVVDVAEHAFALMMAACKNLVRLSDRVRRGNWGFEDIGIWQRMTGKTVSFLGFGKIARAVCKFTSAFGTRTLVYDPYVSSDVLKEFGAEAVDLDTLLKEADFLTLHLPLSDATRHTIGKEELAKMKKTAIIVNTSRGPIIDEPALVDALENGTIAGAGLDVFEDESGGIDPRLPRMRNVVLTPHVAWNTVEAVDAIHVEVAENVAKYLRGERPDSIVNKM
ncbi:MAG: C-terminal binding protein [Clostridia bacterium]|nr:C-terminal binding protein [Clostridia bacterium]